jgi:hypothetical protein
MDTVVKEASVISLKIVEIDRMFELQLFLNKKHVVSPVHVEWGFGK